MSHCLALCLQLTTDHPALPSSARTELYIPGVPTAWRRRDCRNGARASSVQERTILYMTIVSASTARQTLPAQLDRVEQGEEVQITRHGKVVAVLVRPDVLHARRATAAWSHADHVGALLDRARAEPLRAPAIEPDRADELVESIRTERANR